MAKTWPLPENNSVRSGFMEHRGNQPERGEMSDQALADAAGIGVDKAHGMIDDVTEHRATDLLDED